MKPISHVAALCVLLSSVGSTMSHAVTPTEQLAAYSIQAGTPARSQRGQQWFVSGHGKDWSCATCHSSSPTVPGKHASTGKTIAPMAPAFNADRFTDSAKTEKWFRRNCNDVIGRDCTAAEKADVLAWLLTLK